MSEGFKKGKLPDRFKGWTAQTIEMTPSSYIAYIRDTAIKEQNKLKEDKIVYHLNAYYDDELMAAQYVTKMQKLEKALDKAEDEKDCNETQGANWVDGKCDCGDGMKWDQDKKLCVEKKSLLQKLGIGNKDDKSDNGNNGDNGDNGDNGNNGD